MIQSNRSWPGLALLTLAAIGFSSCQKEGALPATASNLAKTNGIVVGLPPVLVAWTGLAGPPYSNGIAGDQITVNQYVRGFTINGIGFTLGTLITDAKWGLNYRCYDLWQCVPATRTWGRRSPYPGDPINLEFGASFVIGDNAYVISADNHVYRYNQPNDSWSEAATFPATFVRYNASCFAINGMGYFGMGVKSDFTTYLNDWYQYDPVANLWRTLHAFPGSKRQGAASFAVDGKGYVAGGKWTGGYALGVWQYTPANDHWTKMNDFPGTSNNIYMPATATGTIGGVDVAFAAAAQAWEYNPAADSWQQLTGYHAQVYTPGGFVVGNAFFVCGLNATVYSWSR